MRTVYLTNKSEEHNIEIYLSYIDLPYMTSISVKSEIALRKLPLWKMLLTRCALSSTSKLDFERSHEISGDDEFFPYAKVDVDDDTLVEIILLASADDHIVYDDKQNNAIPDSSQ